MFIDDFVTKRIRARMQELTLRQAIELCQIPDQLNELGISRALSMIVIETNLPLDEWTAQERIAAICHYIIAQESGDWCIAQNAMMSDYVMPQDYPNEVYSFDDLQIVPLTGAYLEAIERIKHQTRGDWLLAAMAASIINPAEPWHGSPDEFVRKNIEQLKDLSESDFLLLLGYFQAAQNHLKHLVEIEFSQEGLVVLPQKGGDELPSIQFRFDTIMGQTTRQLWN